MHNAQSFGGAPPGVRRANFHYNTPPAICQEKSCTNIKKIKIPILCILPIAFWGWMWYTIGVKGRAKNSRTASVDSRGCEELEKKCKKPLDKPPDV